MKATYTEPKKAPVFDPRHRKENGFRKEYSAVVFNGQSAYTAVRIRIYSAGTTTYCCAWASGNCSWEGSKSIWTEATGSAGGGGYDKASAAADAALRQMGFSFDETLAGSGQVYEACQAIAEYLWPGKHIYINEANA